VCILDVTRCAFLSCPNHLGPRYNMAEAALPDASAAAFDDNPFGTIQYDEDMKGEKADQDDVDPFSEQLATSHSGPIPEEAGGNVDFRAGRSVMNSPKQIRERYRLCRQQGDIEQEWGENQGCPSRRQAWPDIQLASTCA
jgi:hypothetical protein